MNDWRDPRQVHSALTPSDNRLPDSSIYCYRPNGPNGELYVVVPPSKWKRLRELGKLDSYLDKQRR